MSAKVDKKLENFQLSHLYQTSFSASDYLQSFYQELDPEVEFFLQNLHYFFTNEMLTVCKERNVLELGCGPTITSVISASGWASEILMCDFLETNRQTVLNWLHNATDSTWAPFFTYVAALEGTSDARQLENRLRRTVKHVIFADVYQPNLALAPANVPRGTLEAGFDIVVSTLCLEFATSTRTDYIQALQRILPLIAPMGYLMLQGALNNTYYYVKEQRFPSVKLDKEFLLHAFQIVGLQVVMYKEMPRVCSAQQKSADHSGVFCLIGKKVPSWTI